MSSTLAQVLELRGDSFQHFGNAAVVQSIVDRLPEIAREIASPLAKTEKVRRDVQREQSSRPQARAARFRMYTGHGIDLLALRGMRGC